MILTLKIISREREARRSNHQARYLEPQQREVLKAPRSELVVRFKTFFRLAGLSA